MRTYTLLIYTVLPESVYHLYPQTLLIYYHPTYACKKGIYTSKNISITMEEKKTNPKRIVINLDLEGMRAALELRHRKEAKLGHTVSMKEAVTDAIMEKYARDVKDEE